MCLYFNTMSAFATFAYSAQKTLIKIFLFLDTQFVIVDESVVKVRKVERFGSNV